MKRIFTLLLALVMTLALAAPALAAEDVFEAFDVEEAAPEAPIAPEAPVEEAPVEELPAEAPDMPQAAAAEPEDTTAPEDTEPAPDDAQTGKLTVLGDVDQLWYVMVLNDDYQADYDSDFENIILHPGDIMALAMDYRYTALLDKDWPVIWQLGIMHEGTVVTAHTGEATNAVSIRVPEEGSCDLTVTIVADPEAPSLIPVTVTAPEGVYVEADAFALSSPDFFGSFLCDAGYVPFFLGADPEDSFETNDGHVVTSFAPYDDTVESIQVDVRKTTGRLNLTDPEDKVVYAFMYDDDDAEADAGCGIVGGTYLAVQVEAGYSVKADVEPFAEEYFEYEGEDLHGYYYDVPAAGDISVEVVKTVLPVEPPTSGTGWACDEAAGDYYYFVDGVQKSNYWVSSQRGLWYYVGRDGKLATGFQYVENPNGTGWYMFQTDNTNGCIGRMLTGWQWTYTDAGTGWFNTAHGGLNGQCTYTTEWGAYNAATGMWADGIVH